MIHVCFGLYDKTGRYSKFTGTTMLSMFDNHTPPPTAPSITVHILHDNTLSTDNRDKFIYLAGQYGQLVKFYNVEELCADRLKKIYEIFPKVTDTHFSIATFYRFFIVHVLPANIEKIIYLDSDIVVNLDIKELWRIDIGNRPLGIITTQCQDINFNSDKNNNDAYFNAGVLIMNLKTLLKAEPFLMDGIKFISSNPQYKFFDQDVLNYCFARQSLQLPAKFNRLVKWCRWQNENRIGKKIYHYNGSISERSFGMDMHDPFNRLWMKYFMRTPWFDVDAIGRLYDGFKNIQVEQKQTTINLSAAMSGKTRTFFTAPQNVNAVKKIFSIRDDEEIILAEDQLSLKKLIDAMNASRGRKIFFIMLPQFPFQILIQAGFVAGRDFVNGMNFLSEAHGIQFNSHPLIKAM